MCTIRSNWLAAWHCAKWRFSGNELRHELLAFLGYTTILLCNTVPETESREFKALSIGGFTRAFVKQGIAT